MRGTASTKHFPYKNFKPHGLVEFYQHQHTLFAQQRLDRLTKKLSTRIHLFNKPTLLN